MSLAFLAVAFAGGAPRAVEADSPRSPDGAGVAPVEAARPSRGSVGHGLGVGVPHADEVERVLRQNAPDRTACYDERLKVDPDLAGRVVLGWTLVSGRAMGAWVSSNDTGDSELAACLMGALKTWEFPEELEGELTWPFTFHQASPPPDLVGAAREARVGMGTVTTSEGLDGGEVHATIRAYTGDVKGCYTSRLRLVPELAGRVELGFALHAGKVESAWVVSDYTADRDLTVCLVGRLKRWAFPEPLEGDVSVPFTFASEAI